MSLPLFDAHLSYTDRVIAHFLDKPGENVDGLDLARIGGQYAWRTRTAEARKRIQARGLGTIRNWQKREANGVTRSYYVYEPPASDEATS